MTLYQERPGPLTWDQELALAELQSEGVLVPVEPEVGWLSVEDIGPSVVTIVYYEEQPDYMGAEKALIVRIGGDDGEV